MANDAPRRAHPEADSAENGELVPTTGDEIEEAIDDADHHERHQTSSGDAFGLRTDVGGDDRDRPLRSDACE